MNDNCDVNVYFSAEPCAACTRSILLHCCNNRSSCSSARSVCSCGKTSSWISSRCTSSSRSSNRERVSQASISLYRVADLARFRIPSTRSNRSCPRIPRTTTTSRKRTSTRRRCTRWNCPLCCPRNSSRRFSDADVDFLLVCVILCFCSSSFRRR